MSIATLLKKFNNNRLSKYPINIWVLYHCKRTAYEENYMELWIRFIFYFQ